MKYSPSSQTSPRFVARAPTRFDMPAVNDGHHHAGYSSPIAGAGAGPGQAHDDLRADLRLVMRRLLRAAAVWSLMAIPPIAVLLDIQWLGNSVGEQSLVESLQLILLAITAAAFVSLARRSPTERRFAVLAAGFFACMGIRETDAAWDLVFDGLWQLLVAGVALAAVAYAAADWRAALRSLGRFLASRAGLLMTLALGILLVHSRLLGMGAIWEGLLDEQYLRVFKNTVEETTELLGYVLIAASGIVYVARQREFKRVRRPAPRSDLESTCSST